MKTHVSWTPTEDELLHQLYPSAPKTELLTALSTHTRVAIYQRAEQFGLSRWNPGNKAPGKIALGLATPYEIGYAAGFIDGEGTLQLPIINRYGRAGIVYMHPQITIVNTNKESCAFLHTLMGGYMWKNRPDLFNLTWRSLWAVRTSGVEQIRRLLIPLRPYLIIKAKRADLLLRYIAIRQSRLGRASYGPEEWAIHREFYEGEGKISHRPHRTHRHANDELTSSITSGKKNV